MMLILTPPYRTAAFFVKDRDPLLAFEVVRVHDAVVDVLVGPEHTGLPQHGVDQRALVVVDVGDDGDVAQIITTGVRGHTELSE